MSSQLDTVEANANKDTIFDFEEVQLQFQLESKICKVLVKDNYVYLILRIGIIHIINLNDPEVVIDIKISVQKESYLKNAWIDNHGYHLILQSSKYEYFYINHNSKTYHTLSKLKNMNINSISFFQDCVSMDYTGPMLISTTNGLLLEYSIDSNKETLLKTIFKNKYCLTNIFNSKIAENNNVILYSVICFTIENYILNFQIKIPSDPSNNISVFQGLSKIEPLISQHKDITNVATDGSKIGYVESDSKSLVLYIKNPNIINNVDTKEYSSNLGSLNVKMFLLTKYFVLILTTDNHLEIYNQLNLKHLKSVSLSHLDKNMIGICFDELSKTYWLYSETLLFELIINFKDSGLITTMIEQNLYDEALKLLSDDKSIETKIKENYILKRKGYYLLRKKKFKSAIEILAKTDEPFNEIALKLIELSEKAVLRYYLIMKLKDLPKSMKAQKQLLSSWIVEIFIEQLNSQDNSFVTNTSNKNNIIINESTTSNKDKQNGDSKKSDKLQKEFYQFLSENKNCFDKETVYQIIISHNRNDDLLYFANMINDFQFVLKYYISLQRWDESLKVLVTQQNPELIYKCATVLLVNYPVKTIDTWIRLIDDLEELKMMSSLLTYNKTVAVPKNIKPEHNQSLRFLRFLIFERKVSNKIIHNTFFSILITYPNISNENFILKELESYQTNKRTLFGKYNNEILFDFDFILRLSFKYHRIQTAIFIYSILEKNEEAVTLALDNDLINSAILVADKCNETIEQERKNLWLKISEKLITKVVTSKDYIKEHHDMFFDVLKDDISGDENDDSVYLLLKFLTQKCDDLTVKDLLPLFPDFIIIDNFKDSLVESLKRLSLEMNKISIDMDNTLKESKKINEKIKDFKTTNFQIIEPFESCQICHKILAIRKFIVFPCSHSFHQDCLVKNFLDSNDYIAKNSIYKLQKKILMNNKNPIVMDELKQEIDQLLSKSCCLCSDMKINEIDEPLIKSGDKEKIDWDI